MAVRPFLFHVCDCLRWLFIVVVSVAGFQPQRNLIRLEIPQLRHEPATYYMTQLSILVKEKPHEPFSTDRIVFQSLTTEDDAEDTESSPSPLTFLRNIKSKVTFPILNFKKRFSWKPLSRRKEAVTYLRKKISRPISVPLRQIPNEISSSSTEAQMSPCPVVDESFSMNTMQNDLSSRFNSDKFLSEAAPTQEQELMVPGFLKVFSDINRPRNTVSRPTIVGDRWAVSSIDLSGVWDIVVSEEFHEQYDKYLSLLRQPVLVRSVALSIVGLTTEETIQKFDGRELFIRGRNVRGTWERTLISSGADETTTDYEPTLSLIVTGDGERVTSEAWWEKNGTVHRSWLRGVRKYGGGDFESLRYIENDLLVCESTFHPTNVNRKKASVTWRFKKHTSN